VHFELGSLRYEYPDEIVPAGLTPTRYLEQETLAGARALSARGSGEGREADRHELDLIAKLSYEPFFLTVYDIVASRAAEHPVPGPRLGGEFGRLLLPRHHRGRSRSEHDAVRALHQRERNEPPDIDVDFEHQRREEVIQYIYGSTAAIAPRSPPPSTYRPRGALRDVGKALGVDPMLVDRVAKAHRWFDGSRDLLKQFARPGSIRPRR
jgi:error-prone DNA polymerase